MLKHLQNDFQTTITNWKSRFKIMNWDKLCVLNIQLIKIKIMIFVNVSSFVIL